MEVTSKTPFELLTSRGAAAAAAAALLIRERERDWHSLPCAGCAHFVVSTTGHDYG